jgi:hypothetical protein
MARAKLVRIAAYLAVDRGEPEVSYPDAWEITESHWASRECVRMLKARHVSDFVLKGSEYVYLLSRTDYSISHSIEWEFRNPCAKRGICLDRV